MKRGMVVSLLMLGLVLMVVGQVASEPGNLWAYAAYECEGKAAHLVIGIMDVSTTTGIAVAGAMLGISAPLVIGVSVAYGL